MQKPTISVVKLVLLAMVAIFVVDMLVTGWATVQPGEVKVVTRLGEVTGRVLEPGPHLKFPWPIESTLTYNTKLVTYETSPAQKQGGSEADYTDYPVDTNTSDGQEVDISYTIRFSTDPARAAWCAQNVGSELALVEKMVKTESRIWFRNIPRKYSAEVIYTGEGSQNIQEEVSAILEPKLAATCLILDTVGVREIKFDEKYVAAVSEKQVEAVKVDTEKNRADQEEYRKQRAITEAEGAKQVQELQRESLSPILIEKLRLDNQKMWIEVMKEVWNGELPRYVGNDSGLLLTLPAEEPAQ